MRKVTMASIWISEPSRTNHMFHILREVGVGESNHLKLINLQ